MKRYTISRWVMNELKNSDAGLELYVIIQNEFSGSIHKHQIDDLAIKYKKSRETILRILRFLLKKGVIEHPTSRWWHIVSPREMKGHKVVVFRADMFKKHGRKFLRTLRYAEGYRFSCKMSLKNKRKSWEEKHPFEKRQLRKGKKVHAPRISVVPVSAEFFKKCTGFEETPQTILKHLNRAKEFKILDFRHDTTTLFESTDLDMMYAQIALLQDDLHTRMFKVEKHNSRFLLKEYKSNLIDISSFNRLLGI